MAKGEPSKTQIALNKAKSYEGLTWLGLFFAPLSIVFYILCNNKINEAKLYKLSKEEQALADNTKNSSRNIMILVLGLWIIGIAIWVCFTQNQLEQVNRITRRYLR